MWWLLVILFICFEFTCFRGCNGVYGFALGFVWCEWLRGVCNAGMCLCWLVVLQLDYDFSYVGGVLVLNEMLRIWVGWQYPFGFV